MSKERVFVKEKMDSRSKDRGNDRGRVSFPVSSTGQALKLVPDLIRDLIRNPGTGQNQSFLNINLN